jgi:hypothetical protein
MNQNDANCAQGLIQNRLGEKPRWLTSGGVVSLSCRLVPTADNLKSGFGERYRRGEKEYRHPRWRSLVLVTCH